MSGTIPETILEEEHLPTHIAWMSKFAKCSPVIGHTEYLSEKADLVTNQGHQHAMQASQFQSNTEGLTVNQKRPTMPGNHHGQINYNF